MQLMKQNSNTTTKFSHTPEFESYGPPELWITRASSYRVGTKKIPPTQDIAAQVTHIVFNVIKELNSVLTLTILKQ